MNVVKYQSELYKQVNKIYEDSFPKEERYISLDRMVNRKDTELYCLIDQKNVVGFIYLIFYEEMIFILYLAINHQKRSHGYGSYLLQWCLEK